MAPPAKSVKNLKFEPESVQKALVNVILINELPFSVVEQDEVRAAMNTEFPGFQIPSSETVSSDCSQLFVDEKLKLKSLIERTKQRVCLSLDTWTSSQSVTYLCITAHSIDDSWNLYKKIIGFTPVCKDNGEEIGKAVEKCVNDWGINNVLAISAGNASSYDAAVSYLGTRLANPVLDGKYLRLKCLVELTNTMIKGVLKDYEQPIARARAAVRHVLESPDRIKKFKQLAKEDVEQFVRTYGREYGGMYAREHGITSKSFLTLDCPSRWTSTFEMLQKAQKFGIVFSRLMNEDPSYINVDWEKVRNAVYFLHVFHQSHEKILASRVTSNIFLDEIATIEWHLDNWGKSCGGSEKRFFKALDLKWKYTEYWGDVNDSNMLIYIASILDPRQKAERMEGYFLNSKYKHDYNDEGEPSWKKKAEWVVSAAYDLFNEYAAKVEGPRQAASFKTCGYMDYLYNDTESRGLFQRRVVGFGGNAGRVTEIDMYLNEDEDVEDYEGFDVLVWWKANSERYPVLSQMAKDVLAIPISAVPLESDINADGNLLNEFKSSLSPSMAEALVCTQDWIKKLKKQVKMKDGSTKLADKILKGIYEQLEGATSGSG